MWIPIYLAVPFVVIGADAPSMWLTDLERARVVAKNQNLPIFVVLSCPH